MSGCRRCSRRSSRSPSLVCPASAFTSERDHGETAASLAGAGSLDRRVEGEQIGLFGDFTDQIDHRVDALGAIRQSAHHLLRVSRESDPPSGGLGRLVELATDLHDRPGQLVGCGGDRGDVARRLLRRAGHALGVTSAWAAELLSVRAVPVISPVRRSNWPSTLPISLAEGGDMRVDRLRALALLGFDLGPRRVGLGPQRVLHDLQRFDQPAELITTRRRNVGAEISRRHPLG